MKVSVQRLPVEWMPLACRQIKRQAEICKPKDSEHLTGRPIPRRSILYIKGSAEETERILCRFGIHNAMPKKVPKGIIEKKRQQQIRDEDVSFILSFISVDEGVFPEYIERVESPS